MAPSAHPSQAGRGLHRALRTVAPLAAVAAVVSGCTFVNPQDTQRSMVPADGMSFDLGPDVAVASLMIIAKEEGGPGVLLVRVTNGGPDPVSVSFRGAGLDEEVEIPPNETLAIGGVDPGSQEIIIDSVPQRPGKYVPMTFSTADGRSRESVAPVLDGTFPRYAPYVDELPAS